MTEVAKVSVIVSAQGRTINNECFRWIDGRTGRRSDVAHHYLYNQKHNDNLHIVAGVRVHRVLIECVVLYIRLLQ